MVVPVGKVLTKGAKLATKAVKKGLTDIIDADTVLTKAADVGQLDKVKTGLADIANSAAKKSRGQVKTNKQLFFTDIYDPKFAAARKLDPKTKVPDEFVYGGSAHPTGIMTAQKRNPVLPEQLQKEFGRKHAEFPGFQMAPHHFTLDDDLGYSVISKVNPANQSEVVSTLNDTYSIYPGNHPKNFMMSYHDNTKQMWNQTKTQIMEAWEGIDGAPTDAKLNKFLKQQAEGKTIGGKLGATLLEEIDLIADVKKKGLDKKAWSSILPPGMKRSDLKFDPVVLGIDHQSLIHGIGDRLPDRLELLKLSKTEKWAKMAPAAQAREIAKVSRQQQNVALRISGMRLKLIKKRMIELGEPIDDWTDIQAWMIQNPAEAASLNYHKILSEGVDIPMSEITEDLPLKEAQEIASVFNIEVVNKVGPALDANRAEVKAIKRDIAKDL